MTKGGDQADGPAGDLTESQAAHRINITSSIQYPVLLPPLTYERYIPQSTVKWDHVPNLTNKMRL